jgi:hypothetical protein
MSVMSIRSRHSRGIVPTKRWPKAFRLSRPDRSLDHPGCLGNEHSVEGGRLGVSLVSVPSQTRPPARIKPVPTIKVALPIERLTTGCEYANIFTYSSRAWRHRARGRGEFVLLLMSRAFIGS